MKNVLKHAVNFCLVGVMLVISICCALASDLYYRIPFYRTIPVGAVIFNITALSFYLYWKYRLKFDGKFKLPLSSVATSFNQLKTLLSSSPKTVQPELNNPIYGVKTGTYSPTNAEIMESWKKVHSVIWVNR